jgi:hypothetical protein
MPSICNDLSKAKTRKEKKNRSIGRRPDNKSKQKNKKTKKIHRPPPLTGSTARSAHR